MGRQVSVKPGWEPPGQSISGPSVDKKWLIPQELWKEAWNLFYGGENDERIGDIFWSTVKLPPTLAIGLLRRLSRMDRRDHPRGVKPTRREIELSSHIVYEPLYRAVHSLDSFEDPNKSYRGIDPDLDPGPVTGEIMWSALRMQGYGPDQIWVMDKALRLAKVLEAHVDHEKPVAVPMRARKIPSAHESS